MSTVTCSVDRAAWRGNHVWSVARQVALTRAEWSCEECGATDWDVIIHVHHIVPVESYEPGCAHHQDNLRVLCDLHHRMTHRALRARPNSQLALFTRTSVA
jgi:hypothetical protein